MSTTTRNGKIARLPKAIREEINQRLEDGATAVSLVEWLNGLPEVQDLIQSQFGGHPILEQNLSQWKGGGYQDWLRKQEAKELVEEIYEKGQELKEQMKDRPPLAEVLSHWLNARYVVTTRQVEQAEGPEGWRMLRQMCGDVARLRRLDQHDRRLAQNDRRLDIEQQRVEIEQEHLKLERGRYKAEQRATKKQKRSRDDENEEGPEKEPKPHWSECLGISNWPPYVPSAASQPPGDPTPSDVPEPNPNDE